MPPTSANTSAHATAADLRTKIRPANRGPPRAHNMNMSEDPFEDTKPFALTGTTLAYREKGSDETPVVFVHGGLSDLRTWDKQLEAISASRRMITYSRRYARPNEDIPAGAPMTRCFHMWMIWPQSFRAWTPAR